MCLALYSDPWVIMSDISPRFRPADRATLRSGGLETRYLRAGVGRPVLLLAGRPERTPVPAQLFRALADGFRVVWPAMPRAASPAGRGAARPTPSTAWLRGLVDGLGLGRCALVADGSFGLAAAWFALSDPLRVAGLVLVVPEALDPAAPLDAVSSLLVGTNQPVMLVRAEPPPSGGGLEEGVVQRVIRFLEAPPGVGAPAR